MLLRADQLVTLALLHAVMPAHRVLVPRGVFSRFCGDTGLSEGTAVSKNRERGSGKILDFRK
jgi:hypothetical protein